MRKTIISGVILAGLAAPSLVLAQAATPTPPAPQPHMARPEHHRPLPGQLVDARLAFLKTALKITPAQEPQWNAFATVMRQQAREMDAKMEQMRQAHQTQGQGAPRPDAIERLQHRQEFLAAAAARTNALLTAAKPLYASFSPQQKQMADDLLVHDGGHHFRHGWR
jgi:hypothetical protein